MNNDFYPKFIEIHRGSLANESNFETNRARVQCNKSQRDEVHYIEYVRADVYYESLKLLSEKLEIKTRETKIDEKIVNFLLEF